MSDIPKSGLKKYKEYVSARLGKVSPLLVKYAMGDFSQTIEIPEKEDEFTELLVGMNLMVDDIKELLKRESETTARLSAGMSEMVDTVMKVARGNYSVQIELSGENDNLDSLAMGLNMMVDDIGAKEQSLEKKTHVLGERVKELNCLYGLSALVQEEHISLQGVLESGVKLIPPAWQYPEITCARILLGAQVFKTRNFKETHWKLASDIVVHG